MSFNVENYFSEKPDGNIILFYKGNVDSEVINHVLDTVEAKMAAMKEQSRLRKKVYNVLVESLQNLYHHVDKVPAILKIRLLKDLGCWLSKRLIPDTGL